MAGRIGATLAELFRLGLPIGITMVFEVALFNAATLAMGTFGIASLAAHQIAITIPSLTFMMPLGIGLAGTVRVGLAAGAGDAYGGAARRLHRHRAWARSSCACTALVLLLFPRSIASLWLPDSAANRDVLALAVTFLHVAAAFQLMDGMQVTASMSLRGLKDARGPMWLAGASYWLAGAPMCALLGFGLRHARAWASGWAWPSACWWRRCCSPAASRLLSKKPRASAIAAPAAITRQQRDQAPRAAGRPLRSCSRGDLARGVGMKPHAAFRHHLRQLFGIPHQLRQVLRQLAQRADAFGGARSRASGPRLSDTQRSATGRAASQMSKSGSRPRATPSTTTMVFCSSTSCGWACMSKRRVVSNNCPSSRAIETSRGALAEDRLADGAQGLGEGLDRMMRRHEGERRNAAAPRAR